jgi:hypothetical protein
MGADIEGRPGPVICGECDDAPATSVAWFNGRTKMDLCDECFAWWGNHGLIEPREVAES